MFQPFEEDSEAASTPDKEEARRGRAGSPVSLQIEKITLELSSLYEPEYDNSEAFEYLTNITRATLGLESVVLRDDVFTVSSAGLIMEKYLAGEARNERREILKIPGLKIAILQAEHHQVTIEHEEVNIFCEKEEIVMMGKLFSLISFRLKFENYDWETYGALIRNYRPHDSTVRLLEVCLSPPPREEVATTEEKRKEPRRKGQARKVVSYTPKSLNF